MSTASLGAPTVSDIRSGMERLLTEDFDAVWAELCAAARIPVSTVTLDDTEMDRLLAALAARDALCRVLAMSWQIRRTAARKLSALGR